MHATPSPPQPRREPSGFTLFLLFFGSLILTGVFAMWLWNANPAVREGRAFGTPNQVAVVAPVSAPAAGGAPVGAAAGVGGVDPALVAKGQQLATQLGCTGCHTLTGPTGLGPSWRGIAGSPRPLANGQTVVADEEYLREAILHPDAQIVRGFPPGAMPAAVNAVMPQIQQGNNLEALIAYIQSLQ